MRPPRLPFVLAFLAVLGVGGIWGIYRVVDGVRTEISVMHAQARRKAKPRPPRVHAIREEDAASAAKPLGQAVASLDFAHDPGANGNYGTILQSRLRRGDYEALDSYIEQIQKERKHLPGGSWMIQGTMDALSSPPGGEDSPDADWQAHLDRLHAWLERRPASPQAILIQGGSLIDYAWHARGTGYASEVDENGWKAFRDRLAKARGALETVPPRKRDVGWYRLMLRVALGQSWPRDEYEALFRQAVAFEPRFQGFYQAKANYLLPRWHGRQGEWQAFAVRAADELGGSAGDELFAQVEQDLAAYEGDGIRDWRKAHIQEWPRIKRGFEALREEFGPSVRLDNQQFCMAAYAGDLTEARRLAGVIQDRWDPSVWTDHETFLDFRDWSLCLGRYARKAAK